MIRALFLALILLTPAAPLRAGLVWDSATVTIDTRGSTETQIAEFHFRNDSDHPVRIRGARTSCGCTVVAKPEQDVIAPGASGVLGVSHKPKPGSVPRRYRIAVTTDETDGRVYDLSLVVLSGEPRLVVEGRRMLVWEKGEARTPKEIMMRTRPGDSLRVTGAAADADIVSAELLGPENARILHITPKEDATGRARIRLQSVPPLSEMDSTFFAVLR